MTPEHDALAAPPHQPQLDFRSAASKARKRHKQLKRSVARARRVEKEGVQPRDVACPHCGALPLAHVKRDQAGCRTYPRDGGGSRPLSGGRYHKARIKEAARLKERIIRAGERAGEELRCQAH